MVRKTFRPVQNGVTEGKKGTSVICTQKLYMTYSKQIRNFTHKVVFVLFYVFFVVLCIFCRSMHFLCWYMYFCVVLCIFVLFYVFLCCSMYFLCCSMYLCVVLCIFCVVLCNFCSSMYFFCFVFRIFCVVLCIVCFVSFYVLFLCICVLYYCYWVATQLQLNISYINTEDRSDSCILDSSQHTVILSNALDLHLLLLLKTADRL
jgi:hypothetical protein